jgi:hypothetical protein
MPDQRTARDAARKDLLRRIANLEYARECLEKNLRALQAELAEVHEGATTPLERAYRRTHTGTARLRRLQVPDEQEFLRGLEEANDSNFHFPLGEENKEE